MKNQNVFRLMLAMAVMSIILVGVTSPAFAKDDKKISFSPFATDQDGKVTALAAATKDQKVKTDQVRKDVNVLFCRYNELKNLIKDHTASKSDIAEYKALKAEIAKLSSAHKQDAAEIAKLKAEVAKIGNPDREVKKLVKEIERLAQKDESIEKDIEELKDKYDDLDDRVNALEKWRNDKEKEGDSPRRLYGELNLGTRMVFNPFHAVIPSGGLGGGLYAIPGKLAITGTADIGYGIGSSVAITGTVMAEYHGWKHVEVGAGPMYSVWFNGDGSKAAQYIAGAGQIAFTDAEHKYGVRLQFNLGGYKSAEKGVGSIKTTYLPVSDGSQAKYNEAVTGDTINGGGGLFLFFRF